MRWFQHDSDALQDAKIRRLIIKHGVEGYAIYFHCLELIAGNITPDNITFELEHDADIIADNLKITLEDGSPDSEKVENIILSIIELGLFTKENNRTLCHKMMYRLDNTISRNPEINKIKGNIQRNYKGATHKQRRLTEQSRLDKITLDKNRVDKNTTEKIFESLYSEYPKKKGKDDAYRHFEKQYRESKDKDLFISNFKKAIENYKADIIKNKTEEPYIKYASGFFNKLWKDFVNVYIPKINDKYDALKKDGDKRSVEMKEAHRLKNDPEFHKRGMDKFKELKKIIGGAK